MSETEKTDPNKEIKVAKITAAQAIVVAIITTFGAGVTGYFLANSSDPNDPNESVNWLTITELTAKDEDMLAHVTAIVNGIHYTYPSRIIWAEMGLNQQDLRFPIPSNVKSYVIEFEAAMTFDRVRIDRNVGRPQEIKKSQIPSGKRIYELFEYNSETSKAPGLIVHYEIELGG